MERDPLGRDDTTARRPEVVSVHAPTHLDSDGVVGAALDCGVVGHDSDQAALHLADARYNAATRHIVVTCRATRRQGVATLGLWALGSLPRLHRLCTCRQTTCPRDASCACESAAYGTIRARRGTQPGSAAACCVALTQTPCPST